MSPQESLQLKPLGYPDDGGALLRWRNDPRIYRWCRQYEPISNAKHADWLDWQAKDPHTKMYGVWAGETLAGVCGLTSIDWINRRAEFSLYIAPERQRKGLGRRALRALCSHGFSVLNLNLIWGESIAENPAVKMFREIGFMEEGRRRQFYYREGKYVDAVLWSVTNSEFTKYRLDLPADEVVGLLGILTDSTCGRAPSP